MSHPFYIARFLMEIGDLAIFCPFAGAHASGQESVPLTQAYIFSLVLDK
mgnify:CR=1